jgi:hypothetical protein
MIIFRADNEVFEIEVEALKDSVRISYECGCGCGDIKSFEILHEDYEKLIECGTIDCIDEDEFYDFDEYEDEDECICPYCRIEENIEILSLYLDEAINECHFDIIESLTKSIKNLYEIREMI